MNRIGMLLLCSVLFAFSAAVSAVLAYETEDCVRCHGEASRESRLRIPVEDFRGSVHEGQLDCQDCHAGTKDKEHVHRKTVQKVDCNQCHDHQNLHGQGAPRGRPPECHDCHTKHAILPPSSLASSVHPRNLKDTCAECHPRESGRVSMPASFLSFQPSAHRKGDLSGVFDATRCVDCHQGQAAHGEERRLSEKRCGQCHDPTSASGFLLGRFHGSIVAWGTPQAVIGQYYYSLLLVSGMGLFSYGFHLRRRWWRSGRREDRSSRRLERLAFLLKSGLGQKEIFEDRWAGFSHVGIVIGFLVPLLLVLAVQVPFTTPSSVSNVLGLLFDLSGLCGIVGVLAAAVRRAKRGRQGRPSPLGDWVLLGILLAVFFSGFVLGSARISVVNPDNAAWTPVRLLLSKWIALDPALVRYVWRLHFLLVVGLVAWMPYGRLRHAVTAPLNIYHRDLGPTGAMRPLVLERGEPFGASRRQEFTWKQLLDAQACMECGRCEEQCPATASGKPLSPKKLMQDLRRYADGQSLIGERVSEDEIWACTTCHACQAACPVSVEHPQTIMDLRRHLVLAQGRVPPEMKQVFRKLEVYGDPYGKGPARRTEWAKNVKVKDATAEGPTEYLLWIGCEGAFHSRYREVSASIVKVLTKAGLDFAVLGKEERCCGDLPRRMGNEYLFRQLAEQNVQRLEQTKVTRIITLCPHCFHTLKNEYPQFGGDFAVFHYTEVLAGLLHQGRLELKIPVPRRATFHDPCYLARVNGQSSAPREILRAIPGLDLIEMDRSLDKGFCCGAGGGRVWMHEHLGKRINRIRAEEAVALGTERVVTSCPYCLSMLEDGLGSMEEKNLPQTLDLVELLLQSLGSE